MPDARGLSLSARIEPPPSDPIPGRPCVLVWSLEPYAPPEPPPPVPRGVTRFLRLLKHKAVNPARGGCRRLANGSDRAEAAFALVPAQGRRCRGDLPQTRRDRSALICLADSGRLESKAAHLWPDVDKSGRPLDVVFVCEPPLLICPIREHGEVVRGSAVGSMAQANPKRVWHLSRRDEPPCVVSDRELLLLAKLGHLRADDMLWRPDFDGYRTVRSLLGDVPTPQQIRVEAAPPSSGAVETTTLYTMPTTTLGSAKRRRNLVGMVGLLVAVALLAGLGLAAYRFLATAPEPATQDAAVTEPIPTPLKPQSASTDSTSTPVQQPPQPEAANAGSPAGSARHAEQQQQDDGKADVIVRTVKVVDIDPPQVAKASPSVANPAPEGSSSAVPSPLKKPAKPIQSLRTGGEEQASSATSGRVSETPGPSPMGLGPFGFNAAN